MTKDDEIVLGRVLARLLRGESGRYRGRGYVNADVVAHYDDHADVPFLTLDHSIEVTPYECRVLQRVIDGA